MWHLLCRAPVSMIPYGTLFDQPGPPGSASVALLGAEPRAPFRSSQRCSWGRRHAARKQVVTWSSTMPVACINA